MTGNFDKFLYQYRFVIGGILIVIILAGSGFLIWQKVDTNRQKERDQVELLQQQNELLRQALAEQPQEVAGVSDTQESVGDRININTATAEELDTLPGIGTTYAARIIQYRQQNGGFKNIEDIKNVKGIGEATFAKMADQITVGE